LYEISTSYLQRNEVLSVDMAAATGTETSKSLRRMDHGRRPEPQLAAGKQSGISLSTAMQQQQQQQPGLEEKQIYRCLADMPPRTGLLQQTAVEPSDLRAAIVVIINKL